MSFLYPRRIKLHRPEAQTGVGAVGYGGQVIENEDELACWIPASIQVRREGSSNPLGLPGDGLRPTWYVFVPKRALPLGSVNDRDVIIDDQGERYQVVANYWDALGYRLTVLKLET